MSDIDTTLTITTGRNGADYQGDCPLLARIAPTIQEFPSQPAAWECSWGTYMELLDSFLSRHLPDDSERAKFEAQIRDGKYDLMYRGTPIRWAKKDVPGGKLWPA